jgi:hypothetical protein
VVVGMSQKFLNDRAIASTIFDGAPQQYQVGDFS